MTLNRAKGSNLSAEYAETIAAQALGFIASDPARLGRFLAESGLGPANVREAARDPAFLPAVLDFILAHEAELLDFATQLNIDAKYVGIARRALQDGRIDPST